MSRRLHGAVLLTAAAMAATTGLAPAAARPGSPAGGDCGVHALALPAEATGGNVMDIERVPGAGVVYYGTYWAVDAEGVERQQAVIWHGLDGPPVPVGPDGAPEDVAYELTRTGLINGESPDPVTGTWRPWVQKIRTGRVTWVDTGVVAVMPGSVFVRRINDRGALTGSARFPDDVVRALTWRRYHHNPDALTGTEWVFAEGLGINNDREMVGVGVEQLGEEQFALRPLRWAADGTTTPMATSTLGAGYPRLINDAGQAAGIVDIGEDAEALHGEAAFWPTPDRVIGLGLLPGGGVSDGFGLDADGRVAGRADVYDPDDPGADEFGSAWYSFVWSAADPARVRVLPSPHAWERGVTEWRRWYGGAAHGVNAELDQVGTSAHGGYLEDGTTLRMVPTVYVNASACGQMVETTHTPFWLVDPGTADSPGLLRSEELAPGGDRAPVDGGLAPRGQAPFSGDHRAPGLAGASDR